MFLFFLFFSVGSAATASGVMGSCRVDQGHCSCRRTEAETGPGLICRLQAQL